MTTSVVPRRLPLLHRTIRANKRWLLPAFEEAQARSLRAAAREQRLAGLSERLAEIVPDLTGQYTTFALDREALRLKVRVQHAFQVRLALAAVDRIVREHPGERLTIVDIGDSAGTHLMYLKALLAADPRLTGTGFECLSVNLDPAAVERIRARGLRALLCRAEDLMEREGVDGTLLLSFEMIEHLTDPVSFLDAVSRRSNCRYFAVTVPYLRNSRVGLHHIRQGEPRAVYPENTHIFELSPADWGLLFRHAGWEVAEEVIYRQFPRWSFWRVMQPAWRAFDFEGFYGAILRRNRVWAECYAGERNGD